MDVRPIVSKAVCVHRHVSLKSDTFAIKSYRNATIFFAMVVYLSLPGVAFNRMQYFWI